MTLVYLENLLYLGIGPDRGKLDSFVTNYTLHIHYRTIVLQLGCPKALRPRNDGPSKAPSYEREHGCHAENHGDLSEDGL